MSGFQLAELSSTTFVAATTACGALDITAPEAGVNVAEPVVSVKPLIKYWTSATGMVSAAVASPVVKLVEETVAVQSTGLARLSVTSTMPSAALSVPPGSVAPRSALAGTVIESTPAAPSGGSAVAFDPAGTFAPPGPFDP